MTYAQLMDRIGKLAQSNDFPLIAEVALVVDDSDSGQEVGRTGEFTVEFQSGVLVFGCDLQGLT